MVIHVVWWRVLPTNDGKSSKQNAQELKKLTEGMVEQIPSLLEISAGIEMLSTTTEEVDFIIVSKHADEEGLKQYAEHPIHLEAAKKIRQLGTERKAIDFIC